MPRGAEPAETSARGPRTAASAIFVAWIAAALASALPPDAAAHDYRFGAIAVGHVWAPPSDPKADGIPVYGPLLNEGTTVERLVGASSPIAKTVRFRIAKDGKTTWPDAVELAPGKPLALAPWRVHLWLSGVKRPLKDGDSFVLTLTFAQAGQHTVKVIVERTPGH